MATHSSVLAWRILAAAAAAAYWLVYFSDYPWVRILRAGFGVLLYLEPPLSGKSLWLDIFSISFVLFTLCFDCFFVVVVVVVVVFSSFPTWHFVSTGMSSCYLIFPESCGFPLKFWWEIWHTLWSCCNSNKGNLAENTIVSPKQPRMSPSLPTIKQMVMPTWDVDHEENDTCFQLKLWEICALYAQDSNLQAHKWILL